MANSAGGWAFWRGAGGATGACPNTGSSQSSEGSSRGRGCCGDAVSRPGLLASCSSETLFRSSSTASMRKSISDHACCSVLLWPGAAVGAGSVAPPSIRSTDHCASASSGDRVGRSLNTSRCPPDWTANEDTPAISVGCVLVSRSASASSKCSTSQSRAAPMRGRRLDRLWASVAITSTHPASSRVRAVACARVPKSPSSDPAVTWNLQPRRRKASSRVGCSITALLRSGWAISGVMPRSIIIPISLSVPTGIWPSGNSINDVDGPTRLPFSIGSRRDSIQSRISGQIRTSAAQVIVRSMPASDTAAWNSSNTALIRAAVLSNTPR